ncbi:MAG: hypothetical protein JWL83_3929 [Actinomycetia bacterium]|nr:hypothetical protein [Actinomycetes bacterium]
MSASERPLPVPDRDSLPWWKALVRHELLLQRCASCDALRWPPRELCNRCGTLDWTWIPASGRGTVASWVVNHHMFGPGFRAPYVVVAVRLDDQDDIVMPGAYWGSGDGTEDGADLAIGLPLEVDFDDIDVPSGSEPITLLRWRPARSMAP